MSLGRVSSGFLTLGGKIGSLRLAALSFDSNIGQDIGFKSSRRSQFSYSTAPYQVRIVMCNIHLEETEGQFLQDVEQKDWNCI